MADNALEYQLESDNVTLDEDQILVTAVQFDTEAAGRLFDKYYGEIFGYIYHCSLDTHTAEDLTSNVFLSAFRHLGRYKLRQIPFRAWLYRIATNEVRMYWRRRKRIKFVSLQQDGKEFVAVHSATSTIEAAEEFRLLNKALLELQIKYRTVIILRYFEDKAIAEICDITDRKEGTIKAQLHRGLARLQDILVQWGMLSE